MSKRFQIPATPQDRRLFQSAARRAGLSAAEWARRLLRREAESILQEKSWDKLFVELGQLPHLDEWEQPLRVKPRKVASSKDEDWG